MLQSIFILQISQVLGRALFFVFSLWYINRYMGVEAKGHWNSLYSLLGILSVCSSMGFEVWLSRAVAAGSISRKQAQVFLLKVKGPLWLGCLLFGAWYLLRAESFHLGLAIPFAFALVFEGYGVAQQAVFEGKHLAPAMALMSFLKSGGFAILALSIVFSGLQEPSLALFGWLYALMLLVRVIYGWRCWAHLPQQVENEPDGAWRSILQMGAFTLVTVLYFKIDSVMLADLAGPLAAGNYGNAYDFVEGALFLSAAVGAVLYPRLIQAKEDERGPLFDQVFFLVLALATTCITGIWLVGIPLGLWLIGDAFEGAIKPLILLSFCLPFMFGNGLLSRWLFAANREAFALKISSVLALFNIVGNYLLIPKYGAMGAASMTLGTEGLLFLLWTGFGRGSFKLFGVYLLIHLPLLPIAALYFYAEYQLVPIAVSMVLYGPMLLLFAKKVQQRTTEKGHQSKD